MYKTEVLDITLLQPGEQQVRKDFDPILLEELKNSIARYGLLQPILVQSSEHNEGGFNIIAGERRFRVCKELGFKTIPCCVLPKETSSITEMCLVENLHRADLNPIEEAKAYKELAEQKGFTQQDIAQRVGKSRSYITNILRLLQLPENIQSKLENGEVSVGHAHLLLQLDNPEVLFNKILEKNLSVNDLKKMIKVNKTDITKSNRVENNSFNPSADYRNDLENNNDSSFGKAELKNLENQLSRATSMIVSINANSGTLTLKYNNLGELDLFLDKLTRYIK